MQRVLRLLAVLLLLGAFLAGPVAGAAPVLASETMAGCGPYGSGIDPPCNN